MQSSELLALLLTSDHAEQRRFAALELADMPNMSEEVIAALARGLSDEDKGVRDVCAFALHSHNNAAVKSQFIAPLIVHGRIEVRNLAGEVLIKLGAPAADALLPYMTDDNPDNRKFACDIIALLDNTSDHIMQSVMDQLEDPDENVCSAAIDALGRLGTTSCTASLIALYKRNPDLGPYIVQSLSQIGGEEAQEFLLELLSSPDEFAQIAAIDGLALCGTSTDIAKRILAELPTASDLVQTIMLRTVFGLAYRLNEYIELPSELRYVAHRAMSDDDDEIRIAGLFALGNTIQEEDIPSLTGFLLHADESLQRHVLSIVLSGSDIPVATRFTREFLAIVDADRPEAQDLPVLLVGLWPDISEPVQQCVLNVIEAEFDGVGEIGKYRLMLALPALDTELYNRLRDKQQDSETGQHIEPTANGG